MRLIILYGPPAVGKLTIAEKLAAKTGYKIFQNNTTVRAIEPIFDFGTPKFFRTLAHIRLALFEEAAQSDLHGLIFTFCFDPDVDEEFISEAIATVERGRGTVHLVQLTAPTPTLLERVENESRRTHGKIMEKESLQAIVNRYDFFTPYPFGESLTIDTSEMTAEEAVSKIIAKFGLG